MPNSAIKNIFYLDAMNKVTEFCRHLRNNATPAEKVLWEEIRRRNIGGEKFLRQFPIFTLNGFGRKSFYIADFYCAKLKLVIEVDGPIHQFKKEYDDNRDVVMQHWGFSIVRVTNDEVLNNLDKVIEKINRDVQETIPNPTS
jgi:very-short-patch-repair endonuclease